MRHKLLSEIGVQNEIVAGKARSVRRLAYLWARRVAKGNASTVDFYVGIYLSFHRL